MKQKTSRMLLSLLFAIITLTIPAQDSNPIPSVPALETAEEKIELLEPLFILQMSKSLAAGNYKEAFDESRATLEKLKPGEDDVAVAQAWLNLCVAMLRGNMMDRYDELFDTFVVKKFSKNIRLLSVLRPFNSFGMILDNKFKRGPNRGGASRYADAAERDRAQVLALLAAAIPDIEQGKAEPSREWRKAFYHTLCFWLFHTRNDNQAWQLQSLTNLDKLPDYNTGEGAIASTSRAPVDADGNPVFYSVPKSFAAAKSDGERIRYAVMMNRKHGSMSATLMYAQYLRRQFDFGSVSREIRQQYYGVPEMCEFLRTLKDNETVAELADGSRKITLPDDANYIAMFRDAKEYNTLGSIFLNRMQFDRAAEMFEKSDMSIAGQIRGNWGMPSSIAVATTGAQPVIPYYFRNAKGVRVQLFKVDANKVVDTLLENLKKPQRDWRSTNPFYSILGPDVNVSFAACVAKEPFRTLTLPLNPLPHHWETRAELKIPDLNEPGAYVVRLQPEDPFKGGTADNSTISCADVLLWITDSALTVAPGIDRTNFFLNDARTGAPLSDTKLVVMTSYSIYGKNSNEPKIRVETEMKTLQTNEIGMASVPSSMWKNPHNNASVHRFVFAETPSGKLSFLQNFYGPSFFSTDSSRFPDRPCAFLISDRSVFRPGDEISFTAYVRTPSYGDTLAPVDVKTLDFEIRDPKGQVFQKLNAPFDPSVGAATLSLRLPENALLGNYYIQCQSPFGSLSFRIEEYKKPEYLLTVTPPDEPVKLGEPVKVKINAKYYFGAPMPDAKVKYRVFREEAVVPYPFFGVYDWLYGAGYWVCSTAYQNKFYRYSSIGQEMVLDAEGVTDAEGNLTLTIDTESARKRFGQLNLRYTITAEVSDSSNRVVSGSGSVIAAAVPFRVFFATRFGFAKTGEPAEISISARTADSKPVKGRGVLQIFRRAINKNGVPERAGEPLKRIAFVPDDFEKPRFVLNEPGVYELYAEVTSDDGVTQSESIPIYVIGEQENTNLFGTLPLEISTDKSEYQPGDTARVLITTNKPGRLLYILVRSERTNDIRFVKLEGYSTLLSLKLEKDDQPNSYVSVFSVWDGKIQSCTKQLVLPPEKKVLSVQVDVPKGTVKPRQEIPIEITVTGQDGKPVSGAVTMTVYDKALDAVCPNLVPQIVPFFWGWLRHARIHFNSNLYAMTSDYIFSPFMDRNLEYFNLLSDYWYRGWPVPSELDYSSYSHRYYGRSSLGMSSSSVSKRKAAKYDFECSPTLECDDYIGEKQEASRDRNEKPAARKRMDAQALGAEAEKTVQFVRTNFLDRAFWVGSRVLPENGKTVITVPMPDNLTTWRVRVWSLSPDTRVGEGECEIVVSKDLIARLELPRFMVQGDEVSAVANIHNYTDRVLEPTITLTVGSGLAIQERKSHENATVTHDKVRIEPGKHATLSFRLNARSVGEQTVKLTAKSGADEDALELKLPVLVKGFDKQVNACGRLDKDAPKATVTLDVPAQRKPETTALTLNLAPGAAKAMVELLPYLACDDSSDVFGVVNRFVPMVAAEIALQSLGVKFADLQLEKTSRDPLYAEYMGRYAWGGKQVPSFSDAQFNKITAEALRMIEKMVNADGGWGWFSGRGETSWPDTTAYVVDAFLDMKAINRADVKQSILNRGVEWLEKYGADRILWIKTFDAVGNTDALVARVLAKAGKPNNELMQLVYDRRLKYLSPYGFAMLASAYQKGTPERAMLLRNLTQFLKVDDENGTAYLNIPDSFSFFWYGNENMTNAAYLELLLDENPKDVTAQKLANYLVTNIRNSPWRNSTRTLGSVVRALARYVTVSGEGKPDMIVRVFFDGTPLTEFKIDTKNMWQSSFTAILPADKLTTGKHTLELSFEGSGAAYFNTMLNYFSMEDEVKPEGLEMKIRRNYYKLVPDDTGANMVGVKGSVQAVKTLKYKRVPLKPGDVVLTGDLVEVELVSTAKNDYDYVVFEDSMPAGFEYVQPVSGYLWNWSAPIYAEYKERGARFFLRSMPRGEFNVLYRIRAQLPGIVLALPSVGRGVYAPDLKCNGSQYLFRTQQAKP